MGSMCCKKLESPHSPKLPDFSRIFLTCTDQIQICKKHLWDDGADEPKQRKFSASDISYPLPLGCTILPPKRPPRKKKRLLSRTTSVVLKNSRNRFEKLKRSKSIHDIRVYNVNPAKLQEDLQIKPIDRTARRATSSFQNSESDALKNVDLTPEGSQNVQQPTTNEIILNVIAAAGGTTVPLDSPTEVDDAIDPKTVDCNDSEAETDDERIYDTPYDDSNDFTLRFDVPTVALQPSQFYRQFDYTQSILEPIMESAFESIESTTSNASLVENKKHFLATLLEDNNNNSSSNMPSRKSSITESLREFECSLYDMLEQEPAKEDVDDLKWRPQIPV
ncbi:Hypothetical protein NTJ_11253 [Nesidiocoris tenuis]|uniref:Uncharacterized protein n=1 Tax=Nesidiocoris tenuis TaxID=355587 RepID=A0ABN7B2F6_9HEMI|nr:Hypothetical protein NTJ_11253 [Nesidiocoris tenuis]